MRSPIAIGVLGSACLVAACHAAHHSESQLDAEPQADADTVDAVAPRIDAASITMPGTIYTFGGSSSPMQDGAEPKGTLTAVTSGGSTVLYGRTAIGGGSSGCGTIFSIDPDGGNYQVVYRFSGADGCDPRHDAMIVDPSDGRLYATTQGVNQATSDTFGNFGQIFSFEPGSPIASPIPAVHTFANPTPTAAPYDGAEQHSSFSIDPSSGVLYGQTAAGGGKGHGMLYSVQTDGSAFTDIYDFTKAQGDDPHGRIVLVDRTLYGIAREGGSSNFGAVYAYALDGGSAAFTVLHTFAGGSNDGASSDHGYLTPVVIDGQTILFGMTQCGGSGTGSDACSAADGGGDGVIFQIDPTAAPGNGFNVVYSFRGVAEADGAAPYGSLMYDGTYLYGTTSAGGQFDKGTVFRFTPPAFDGTVTPTILYAFGSAANDGAKPIDNVIEVGSTLYGMTVYGGTTGPSPDSSSFTGNGAIFALPLSP